MRWATTLLGVVLLLGSLAALALRPVPPGHVGMRDGQRHAPGLRWAVEWLYPLEVVAEGPVVHGIDGAEPAILGTRGAEQFELGGIRAQGTPVSAVQAAIARGGQVKGFEVFSVRRPAAARGAADRRHAARITARGQDLRAAIARIEADAAAEARAHEEARALAMRRHERARAAQRAEAEATVARIRAEAALIEEATATAAEAEAARILADGTLALERAAAERDRLRGAALARPGGRWYLAIEAARRFEFDPDRLDPSHPQFFQATWGLAAWRAYFLGAPPP